jgi:O-methyltransferase involved in polyketide biosynthesis
LTGPEKVPVRLGSVQETLFIPLAARARESRKRHPVLQDPKAAEIVAAVDFDVAAYGRGWGGGVTVLRTAIFDHWVGRFLVENPPGTVIELGTGLNSRFERVDNGTVHWIDLDLPDTIDLRRNFFANSDRRQMVAASVLEDSWMAAVEDRPPPYLFVAEGLLAYLTDAPQIVERIAARFPRGLMAFDTYTGPMLERQHQLASKRNFDAPWAWSCDDPLSLTSLGLDVVEAAAVTRPPSSLRPQLPVWYRLLLPVVAPILGDISALTMFRSRRR